MNIYAAKLDAAVPKCVTQLLERVTSFTHSRGRGRMGDWNVGIIEELECWKNGTKLLTLSGICNADHNTGQFAIVQINPD